MIDVHTHILPSVDDGPADPEQAQAMLEMAAADGTRVLVATPHSDLRYHFDPELCRSLIEDLRKRAPAGLRLCSGCEVHLTPENIERVLETPASYALDGGDCILLELALNLLPPMVEPAVEALTVRGSRVIIAHPERNPYLQRHPSFAARLVELGCYLQLTAGSLTGAFGPAAEQAAEHFLTRRLAHFVASDGHGPERRRPLLSAAYAKVSRTCGTNTADLLFRRNPDAALNAAPIAPMPPAPGWLSGLFRLGQTLSGTQPRSTRGATSVR